MPYPEPVGEGEAKAVVDIDEEDVKQGDILLEDKIVGSEQVTLDERGPGARDAQPLQTPQTPTPAQVERHNLTHMPYQPWCPFCVATRRKNTPHRRSHEAEREVPLVVGIMPSRSLPKTEKVQDQRC